MDSMSRWVRHASPKVKLLMAVSVITAVYVGNKYWYVPYARRQRHLQAEEWANIIIEQEERMKKNIDQQQ